MKIDFVGMIYFFHQKDGRLVLLPNGRDNTRGVERHFASFFLRTEDVDLETSDWWEHKLVTQDEDGDHLECFEFPVVKPSTITVSGVSSLPRGVSAQAALKTSGQDGLLPMVKTVNNDFEIDTKNAETIARLSIKRGEITAFRLGEAAVSQLVSDFAGPITIEARSDDGIKTIQLKKDAEIVFSNTSDIFKKRKDGVQRKSHFMLFGKLDVNRDFAKLSLAPPVNLALPNLPTDHPYIGMIRKEVEVPKGDCSNQCC